MNKKETFIKNLIYASGQHGMKEVDLHKGLFSLNDIDKFIYSLKKAFELKGSEWLTSSHLIYQDFKENWSHWHHVDEKYSKEWGFDKKHPGCYVYGLFLEKPENKPADFLCEEVFYIGESRAISRNCMIGRRGDFISTVRNEPLCPYGCGTSFKKYFGKEKIDYVYQAYLPLPSYKCLERETELLVQYYQKYKKLPVCNFHTDENRIKKLSSNLENFLNE
jgi:hypothetical protein